MERKNSNGNIKEWEKWNKRFETNNLIRVYFTECGFPVDEKKWNFVSVLHGRSVQTTRKIYSKWKQKGQLDIKLERVEITETHEEKRPENVDTHEAY